MNETAERYLWCARALLPGGWADAVRLGLDAAGDLVSVEPGADEDGAERVAGAVLPGMPNLHSHAFQRAAAGLTERRHSADGDAAGDSFWTWREVMHGFVTRLGPDDHEAIAAQLYVEMLKAGYTAVGEFHYLHLDPVGAAYADPGEMAHRAVRAAKRAGIGMTMLPVLYSVGGYGGAQPNPGQRRYILEVDRFLELVGGLIGAYAGDADVRVGIAPHSVRQVPAAELKAALDGFAGLDAAAPIHIHAAEQVKDVDEHVRETGARPVAWLLEHAGVDARWCLVHATHLDIAETRGLAVSGAVAGLCPTTEANLGDGLFPLADYLGAGGAWGIGSDSHVSVSAVEELRWLEYGQRLATRSRNVAAPGHGGATGARLLTDALSGGARALGRPIGALAPGRRADLVVLDTDHPQLAGRAGDALIDSWIFSGNANPVRHVMTGGRWVIRDGRHAEEDAIADAYRATVARMAGAEGTGP
ncbi:MAG: formimidoylglutamate deiminase [Magnetovibrio sp.]|nr:formimidoylglutamate deiminase [Magnetovibrio sp.]